MTWGMSEDRMSFSSGDSVDYPDAKITALSPVITWLLTKLSSLRVNTHQLRHTELVNALCKAKKKSSIPWAYWVKVYIKSNHEIIYANILDLIIHQCKKTPYNQTSFPVILTLLPEVNSSQFSAELWGVRTHAGRPASHLASVLFLPNNASREN